ncbi:hypothetical protein NGM99_21180 [Mesorhizobium sp. RP14(2022)]|uniref:IraD/Gp25-like domain-containing protein n=1 Tax=Mesorhizobium liriopis TaxID=2953882 RepID=A0ABT1CDN3_9HYPH|nr:hypothetical protein [Mesorhizobium liriopis]MCO6052306.1 hypothetical protein [Mesorhizobium liriopis]
MNHASLVDHHNMRVAATIRRTLQHILTAPKEVSAGIGQASFGAISRSGTLRSHMTDHAVVLSVRHVIADREPRVADLNVSAKIKRGKLVSLALAYTIKPTKQRDQIKIDYV